MIREITRVSEDEAGMEEEMWAKFDNYVEGAMDPAKAADVRSRLEGFEALDDVGELMRLLRAAS